MLKRLVRRCACGRDWCALTLTTAVIVQRCFKCWVKDYDRRRHGS